MSAIGFVLKAFVPYTHENYLLATQPLRFYEELAEQGSSRAAFHQARTRALKTGLIEAKGDDFRLTLDGYNRLLKESLATRADQAPDQAQNLLVTFDIPETIRKARLYFREALATLNFEQIQRSVWLGNAFYADDVIAASRMVGVHRHVRIFRIDEELAPVVSRETT